MVNSYAVYFKDHTLTDTLFYSPALYMYLAIILLVALQFVTKSKEMYLIYVPNIINIIGVFLTCPLNENRSLYPNLLIAYMLVIVFISIYLRGSMKALTITLNTKKAEEPPQRSYQSPQTYDVSDNYFDNQINEISLEEIDSILEESEPLQSEDSKPQTEPSEEEYDSDLIDQILKEIEDEKQNKD